MAFCLKLSKIQKNSSKYTKVLGKIYPILHFMQILLLNQKMPFFSHTFSSSICILCKSEWCLWNLHLSSIRVGSQHDNSFRKTIFVPQVDISVELPQYWKIHIKSCWRHDVIQIFAYETSWSAYIPSLSPINPKVLEMWDGKVCCYMVT